MRSRNRIGPISARTARVANLLAIASRQACEESLDSQSCVGRPVKLANPEEAEQAGGNLKLEEKRRRAKERKDKWKRKQQQLRPKVPKKIVTAEEKKRRAKEYKDRWKCKQSQQSAPAMRPEISDEEA